jgi:hypothetical protein
MTIRAERRDSIGVLSPRASQHPREAMRPLSKLTVRKATFTIDNGGTL